VRKGNSWGLQFHPEKSSHAGRRIIWNFVAQVEEIVRGRADAAPTPGATP
jgi:GMP synthase-like glutamine amidotransferase